MYSALVVSSDGAFLARAARHVPIINQDIAVLTAAGAAEALAKLGGPDPVDVVVCDHRPPALDAFAFFRDLSRANDGRPFIIVADELSGEMAAQAFEQRMDYYVPRSGSSLNLYMDLAAKIVLCAERRRSELNRVLNERRMRALLALSDMHSRPLSDIINFAVEASVSLTDSKIGYVAVYDNKKRQLKMIAWSKSAMDMCRTRERPLVYDLDRTGVWGEPIQSGQTVIINDYEHDLSYQKKGTPAGHVPLQRLLMIPIFLNGRVVATAGVGNKEREYTTDDENQLKLLMSGLMGNYEERMLTEENERTARTLQSILSTAPVGLVLTDPEMRLTECNRYAQEVLGISDTERLTQPLNAYRSKAAEQLVTAMEAAKLDDKPRDTYVRGTVDGREVQAYASVSPVMTADRKADGFLVVLMDVTGLALKNASSRETMDRMRAFTTIVAAELGRLDEAVGQRVRAGPFGAAEAAELTAKIDRIKTFMDRYSRIGAQSPVWQRLADGMDQLPPALEADTHVSGIRILADQMFPEVFRLFGEYSAGHGAKHLQVSARIDGGQLTIGYADDGAGIPQEFKDLLFSGHLSSAGAWALTVSDIVRVSGFRIREFGIPGRGLQAEISVPASCFSVDIG